MIGDGRTPRSGGDGSSGRAGRLRPEGRPRRAPVSTRDRRPSASTSGSGRRGSDSAMTWARCRGSRPGPLVDLRLATEAVGDQQLVRRPRREPPAGAAARRSPSTRRSARPRSRTTRPARSSPAPARGPRRPSSSAGPSRRPCRSPTCGGSGRGRAPVRRRAAASSRERAGSGTR